MMFSPKLYILSRKFHRFMVIVISVLALAMMVTGLNLKYGWFASFLNLETTSEIHNLLSPYFAAALGINLITGFYMYLYTQPRKSSPNGGNGQTKV